jgi:hypothetical protein
MLERKHLIIKRTPRSINKSSKYLHHTVKANCCKNKHCFWTLTFHWDCGRARFEKWTFICLQSFPGRIFRDILGVFKLSWKFVQKVTAIFFLGWKVWKILISIIDVYRCLYKFELILGYFEPYSSTFLIKVQDGKFNLLIDIGHKP